MSAAQQQPQQRGAAPYVKLDAEFVISRLEEAGRTLLAMPGSGKPNLGTRVSSLATLPELVVPTGFNTRPGIRPPVPSSAAISRMDTTYGWLALVPQDRYVLRRIVGMRSLVSPLTDWHLFSWRRIAGDLSADYRAVQRWHAEGIRIIVRGLAQSEPAKRLAVAA